MNILINAGIIVLTILMMEAWAWFMHKYLLHGPLWFLHKTHHEPQPSWWEWNDLVSILYAVGAVVGILQGAADLSWPFWVGIGITAYGLLYFVFHDIIIHRRIKIKYHFESSYINRLIRAHKKHHKHMQKHDSEAFGFLYASSKYNVKRSAKQGNRQKANRV